jgi:hypothetical protein
MVPSLRVPMSLTIDGELVPTSTTVHWSGAHVVTIATVIAHHDLPLALTSPYIGAPGARTHVTHLQPGPTAQGPTIETIAFHDAHGTAASKVFYRAAGCAYDHAHRLLEWLFALLHEVTVDLADDAVAVLDAVIETGHRALRYAHRARVILSPAASGPVTLRGHSSVSSADRCSVWCV